MRPTPLVMVPLLALAGCALPAVSPRGAESRAAATATAGARCAATETGRQSTRTPDGAPIYVDPKLFEAADDGQLLVAGPNIYTWRRSGPGRAWQPHREEALFGMAVDVRGVAHPVPLPASVSRVLVARAIPRGRGRWEVVFAASADTTSAAPDSQRTGLWHGWLTGTRWRDVEPIPVAAGEQPDARATSALVSRGDTLVWAVVQRPHLERPRVVLHRRIRGHWSSERVPTPSTAYVDIDQAARELRLAVVGPDTTLRYDDNSLFLYVHDGAWSTTRIALGGGTMPAFDPRFVRGVAGVLTWRRELDDADRSEAVAWSGSQAVVLDGAIAPMWPFSAVAADDGSPVAAVQHEAENGERELRLIEFGHGPPAVILRSPYPYVTYAALSSPRRGWLVLAGARQDPRDSLVTTLAIHLRVACR